MSFQKDVKWAKFDDGVLSFQVIPLDDISQWTIVFEVREDFESSSGLIVKSIGSGMNALSGSQASGISISSSGEGRYNIHLDYADTSGLSLTNYAYTKRS